MTLTWRLFKQYAHRWLSQTPRLAAWGGWWGCVVIQRTSLRSCPKARGRESSRQNLIYPAGKQIGGAPDVVLDPLVPLCHAS